MVPIFISFCKFIHGPLTGRIFSSFGLTFFVLQHLTLPLLVLS